MVSHNKIIKGFMTEIAKLDPPPKKKEPKCYHMRPKAIHTLCCDFNWGRCKRLGWLWFRLK